MISDLYSGIHASDHPAAVVAFETAVWNVAAHRPAAGPALAEAQSLDPDMTAAHALHGFANVLLARDETMVAARADLRAAWRSLQMRGGGPGEQALVAALDHAVAGRLRDAAATLEHHLTRAPRDLLALKLSHGLRFMSGDPAGMLAASTAILPAWSPSTPGYGFVLGCHAFALEENGRLKDAETLGRQAVAAEPADAWGLHAVGHVCEMQGRVADGVAWLEDSRGAWSQCNNFAFHMAWHLSLFHLARDRADLALALYDTQVRPSPTDDFRDVANAVSLLWRLRQEGVGVGDRWAELAEIARRRATDTTLIFASLHYLLALVAVGDLSAARVVTGEIAARAQRRSGDQALVAQDVGADLARAILSLATGAEGRVAFRGLARDLVALGGSHAQRDVFMRTLALIAAQSGKRRQLQTVLTARLRLKREDRFCRLALERLGLGSEQRWQAA